MYKKTIVIFLAALLSIVALFSGCTKEEAPVIKIAALAGPSGMGMTKIIDDDSGKYEVTMLTAPDQILPKVINKEADICAVPSNVSSVLYNKTEKQIKVISITTTGVLYILENGDTISSLEDLRGKTIYSSGQGASPEYVLNEILSSNGIDPINDVEIVYVPEHATLANMLAAGEAEIALLPEPFVSVTTAKNADINVQIDMSAEWEKLYGEGTKMPIGVAIVQKDFLEKYPKAVEQFMEDYKASVDFVNSDIDAAAELIAEQAILPSAAIAKNAIPRSGVSFIVGDDLEKVLGKYLEVLNDYNPSSIGGTLPDENFYYKK